MIDKALAFARKSRNRLFRVHRDLELLKWNNKLEGMGVRQWYVVMFDITHLHEEKFFPNTNNRIHRYWAFGFTTPRPTVTDKGFYGDKMMNSRERNVSRFRSFNFQDAGKKFMKKESKFSSGDLGDVFDDDDEEEEDEDEDLPILQIKNVNNSPESLGVATPPPTPFGLGLYTDDVERAVREESKRVEECPKLPPEPLKRKEHGILLPWSECTDVLEFKIWDEDFSVAEGFGDEEIGNCKVKLLDFIPNPTSEGAKGRQPEIWKWIPVNLYPKHEKEQRRLGRSTGKGNAWLLVRCQVVRTSIYGLQSFFFSLNVCLSRQTVCSLLERILRERISITSFSNHQLCYSYILLKPLEYSEHQHSNTKQILRQGDKDVNFDDSKSGYLYLYNRTISVIKYINDFLEEAVVFYEKFKNLLNWTHPRKTQVRHFLSLKKIKIQALL